MSDLSGAEKRAELFTLARECRHGAGELLGAAMTQIAGLDLDDPEVCDRWAGILRDEYARREGERSTVIERAADILKPVSP